MKAKERIMRYGVAAYLKMRGLKKTPSLFKYYTEKYIGAPLEIKPPSEGRISRHMKSYWRDVKDVVKGRKWGIKKTRKVMKREAKGKDVSLRITRSGEGWQLVILGEFKEEKTDEIKEAEGWSYTHAKQDYAQCLDECIRAAQHYTLGGSNWKLVRVLKSQWNRFYGRQASISENNA